MKDIESMEKSLKMKLANAKRLHLKPAAMMIYLEGKAKLSRATQLAESGFRVREPSVVIPAKFSPKKKKETVETKSEHDDDV